MKGMKQISVIETINGFFGTIIGTDGYIRTISAKTLTDLKKCIDIDPKSIQKKEMEEM